MISTIRSLILMSFTALAIAACVGEAAAPADLQATQQPLQNKGVYYLQATGTAESATFTFYDQNKVAIGTGGTSQSPQLTKVQWRGNQWDGADGAFSKNGVVVNSDGADAAELDTVLTVVELSLDQAFAPNSSKLDDQVQPNACPANRLCSRPNFRCTGDCTGFVCSDTRPNGLGVCQRP
jgi:hypothetical protein